MYHFSHSKKPVLLFDLDDTLCNSSRIKRDVLKKIYDNFPQINFYPFEDFVKAYKEGNKYYKEINKTYGFNTYSRITLWEHVFSLLNISLSISEICQLIEINWQETIARVSLYPNVKETLKKLYEQNYVMIIVSGGDYYSKAQKLIKLEIVKYFTYLFPTDLVQMDKQTGEIYRHILKVLNLKGNECIMIGDTINQDIEPANKEGITTVQVTTRGDKPIGEKGYEKPDYVIADLSELLEIVRR